MTLATKMDRWFGITERGSTIRTEVLAGVSTFLALSYIFVVNPAILAEGGMDKSMVFFATIVGSVLTTLLMGLWARLPFVLAPGLEMNAYVAYAVIGTLGFAWQGAMGAVFWSGVLCIAISCTPIRVNIIHAIPNSLKGGLSAAVGVFLLLIALKVSGMTAYEGIKIQGIGSLTSPEALVFYAGLILVMVLRLLKVKGAVLLSIIGSAVVAHLLGIGSVVEPIAISRNMLQGFFALDFSVILNPKIWSVLVVLFILDFYGSIAKLIGLSQNTSIRGKNGEVPRMKEALIVDGGGTVLGAVLGTSNLITYVESAVGIGEGGRTGLVAIVCAVLMSLFLFITPLINLIPVVATTGALFYVGIMLMPKWEELKTYHWSELISVIATIIVTIWTFGLDKAMFAGFATFVLALLVQGKWRQMNVYLLASTILLLISILLSV